MRRLSVVSQFDLRCRGTLRSRLRGADDRCRQRSGGPERHADRWNDTLANQAVQALWVKPGFPFCLPRMAPLYTRGPPSARNSVHRTIVQLQRPSPQPALTCDRLEPLLSGHSSDTAPHLCPFFVRRASLHSPRVSLPGPVAPRSSAACRRTAAGSDALPPAGASSTSRASPAGLRFSPAAAASSSATSA